MLHSDTPARAARLAAVLPATFVALLFLNALTLQAQTNFGAHAVGTTVSLSVTVNATVAGTVSTLDVLTYGAANLDFTDANDTCRGASLSAAGQSCAVTVSFTPSAPGPRLGAVVLLDGSGSALGTSLLQGTGTGGLAVFFPPNEQTFAGSGSWTGVEDGGPAVYGSLNQPASVTLDGAGNVYIADALHNRVRMVSSGNGATIHNSVTYPQAGYITTVAGNGAAAWTGDHGPASDPTVSVNYPASLAVDGAGNLYVADAGNNVIRKIDAATGIITTVAGNGQLGSTGDNGPATQASLNDPQGVSADAAGNLYIADTANHKIRAVCAPGTTQLLGVACVAAGNMITVAGNGYMDASGGGAFAGDGGPATGAKLNYPYAIAFDTVGNMYIPDSANNRVRIVSPSGAISTFAGNGTAGFAGDGGVAAAAHLQTPTNIAVDPAQNVLICDSQNNAIREVEASSKLIYTIVQSGVGESYTGGKIATMGLYGPKGIALDSYGNLFVADTLTMHVRMLQSSRAFLDFRENPVVQGAISSSIDQTIENDGNDDLTLSSISPGTNAAYDSASTTCLTSSPIPAGGQCVLAAKFAPSSAGNPVTGTIQIAGQTGNTPLELILAGDATPADSTTTVVTSNQNPTVFGQTISITATVITKPGTGAATGTFSSYDGTKLIQGGVAVNALGSAPIAVSGLSVSTHSITAVYSGDPSHLASTSLPMNQLVNEATAVNLTPGANPALVGTPLSLTATVSAPAGGAVTPDGLVAFLDGTSVLGTASANSNGVATLTVSNLSRGAHALVAEYGGDTSRYVNGSTSPPVALNVVDTSKLMLVDSPNPSSYGTRVTFTATLTSSGSVSATGTIGFYDGGLEIGSGSLAPSGVATFTSSALTVGMHTITASYAGDQNVQASTSAGVTQIVNAVSTHTVLTVNPGTPIAGALITFTATVTPATGAGSTTGTVTFLDGKTSLGSFSVSSGGTASLQVSYAPGSHTFAATYSGDQENLASTSATLPVTIAAASTQVALASSSLTAEVLAPITFTAVTTGNGITPTGMITFSIDGTNAASAALDSTGKASFTDSALAVGTHTVSATYGGDTNDLGSSSGTLSQIIGAISTVTALDATSTGGSSPQPILLATVTSGVGPVATGTVTFMSGSSVIGSAVLVGAGAATFVPQLSSGTYSIVASYGGDADHAPSTSAPVSVTGTLSSFAMAVTPTSLSVAPGQSRSLTISMKAAPNFSDSIKMGCIGLPAEVSCYFSPATVQLQGGQTKNVQVVVNTEFPLTNNAASRSKGSGPGGPESSAILLSGGLLGWFLRHVRRRSRGLIAAITLLWVVGAMGICGCGSTFGFSKASPGTYTIQVGGTGTNTNTSFFQNITLTIQ